MKRRPKGKLSKGTGKWFGSPGFCNPPQRRNLAEEVAIKVIQNSFKPEVKQMFEDQNLRITVITWEDTARFKGSCWGPNISDMTLRVEGVNLPVVRVPNFEDATWDVEMNKIQLVVGNESGSDRRIVNLTEYLQNFTQFQTGGENPTSLNLHAGEKDEKVIMSAQSCYLPIQTGKQTEFGVNLFNYQSRPDDPAVLVIVANSSGTSAQTVGNDQDGNFLYFNDNGEKCPFVGERLADDRDRRGVENSSQAMTADEQSRNCLMIIQVPLKPQKPIPREVGAFGIASTSLGPNKLYHLESATLSLDDDIDHAMIHVGESQGAFPSLPEKMVRDSDYPCRVTLQYYKATSNGVFSQQSVSDVAQQLREATRFGEGVSSLVVDGDTGRQTEWIKGTNFIPDWWSEFWNTCSGHFVRSPTATRDQAEQFIFGSGKLGDLHDQNPGQAAARLIELMIEFNQVTANNVSRANKRSDPVWEFVGHGA